MEFDDCTRFQKMVVRHKCMLPTFTLDPASYFMDYLNIPVIKLHCGKKRYCLLN